MQTKIISVLPGIHIKAAGKDSCIFCGKCNAVYPMGYETLLKLFSGNELGPTQALSHIEAFEKKIENELPYLLYAENILTKRLKKDATHKYYLLTVRFGIKTYRTYLEWCGEAKALLTEDHASFKDRLP